MKQNLEGIRKEIDKIDDKIIGLLGKRKNLVREIAKIKKELNKPILDEEREAEIIERLKTKSKEKGLDENFICTLYKLILENSRNEQKKN